MAIQPSIKVSLLPRNFEPNAHQQNRKRRTPCGGVAIAGPGGGGWCAVVVGSVLARRPHSRARPIPTCGAGSNGRGSSRLTRCHVLTPRPDLQRQIRRFGDHTMDLGIVLTHPAAVRPVFKRRREHPMDLRTPIGAVVDESGRVRAPCTWGAVMSRRSDVRSRLKRRKEWALNGGRFRARRLAGTSGLGNAQWIW